MTQNKQLQLPLTTVNKADMSNEQQQTVCVDCDEQYCDACFAREAAYWAKYFGLRPDMTREQRREQLQRMKPAMSEDNE